MLQKHRQVKTNWSRLWISDPDWTTVVFIDWFYSCHSEESVLAVFTHAHATLNFPYLMSSMYEYKCPNELDWSSKDFTWPAPWAHVWIKQVVVQKIQSASGCVDDATRGVVVSFSLPLTFILCSTISLVLRILPSTCSIVINAKTDFITNESSSPLHPLAIHHPLPKTKYFFLVDENASDIDISCCVKCVWKGNSGQCPGLILQTWFIVHVRKRLLTVKRNIGLWTRFQLITTPGLPLGAVGSMTAYVLECSLNVNRYWDSDNVAKC